MASPLSTMPFSRLFRSVMTGDGGISIIRDGCGKTHPTQTCDQNPNGDTPKRLHVTASIGWKIVMVDLGVVARRALHLVCGGTFCEPDCNWVQVSGSNPRRAGSLAFRRIPNANRSSLFKVCLFVSCHSENQEELLVRKEFGN